jgi:hypothetical protein
MRNEDYREIMCQLPPGSHPTDAGHACFNWTPEEWKWCACIDGSPVAAFGLARVTFPVWTGWAFGLPQMKWAVPAMSRHLVGLREKIIAEGCRCIEVHTIKGHAEAHLWIRQLGGKYRVERGDRGRNGETFELWSWELSEQEI